MEKYFTTIEAFACKHGHCFSDKQARLWLMELEKRPLPDQHGLYEMDRVNFISLKIIFKKRWGITEEFHYIYETWKELVAKHGYNPFGKSRDSVTYKQNKDTVKKEVELNKIKKILGQ